MRRMRKTVLSAAMIGVAAFLGMFLTTDASLAAGKKTAASGKTQIVAKLNKREITISDLRNEMARLGLSPNEPNSERIALDSIINRALLADAARSAKLHRKPEALRRIAVAQEQALADLYLATASRPPEPTIVEIQDYVTDNPTLFAKRAIYSFLVLTMPSEKFDQESFAPLFDESADFVALGELLDKADITYAVAPAVQPSNAFPEAIREQLAAYDVRDNIVIQGDENTQIMKITSVQSAPIAGKDASKYARQTLMRKNASARAESMLANLKRQSALSYYRETAAPPAEAQE